MRFLGMDGGGTHIAVSIVDENENLTTKFEINTGVNLTSVNEERLKEIFEEIYSKTGKVRGIVVSFSGAGTQNRKIKLQSIIKEIFCSNNVTVYNDGESILFSVYSGSNSALTIAGTGTIVMGITSEKQIIRSGGWGHLFDDIGGGFWISTRIIQEAFRYRDGLREYDPIFDNLKLFYGFNTIEDLTSLQGKEDFKTIISSFTKVALNEPTPLVKIIVEEGIQDLTFRCKMVLDKLEIKELYMHGGLFNSPYYNSLFRQYLHSYSLFPLEIDVCHQMALLAKKLYY
ncbi:MAG TPA: BadF/BadG/BcrA/BcrD ATPase family protein [Defluviitoga sp.]|nr:BadF/BadG/BcrA/BcrD ATPase family protein [Defluviitoga sp.]